MLDDRKFKRLIESQPDWPANSKSNKGFKEEPTFQQTLAQFIPKNYVHIRSTSHKEDAPPELKVKTIRVFNSRFRNSNQIVHFTGKAFERSTGLGSVIWRKRVYED